MDWQKLAQAVMVELENVGEANSCIMAASVLLRVLHLKGLKGAYPLTVKPRVFNPKFTARLESRPHINASEIKNGLNEDGCAMIAIGHGEGSEDKWPAHLVVVIPHALKGKDAICDLTITQANKPEWGIKLGQIMAGVRDSFINGTESFGVIINGCRVIYKAFPDDVSFKETPIWNRRLERDLIVKRIMKQLNH
jgi:hypothetical protein